MSENKEVGMKYRIEYAEDQAEDIVVYAKGESPTLSKIEALLREDEGTLFGYSQGDVVRLESRDIYCFCIEAGRVYALTEHEKLYIKERLYHLETLFGRDFIKINQSCLVNMAQIKRFDASLGGALTVVLKNGYRDYVSRRQLGAVKKRLGI